MTHNERQLIKKAVEDRKKERTGKYLGNYTYWLSAVRKMGIDGGLTLTDCQDRFNIHTIGNMFIDGVSPENAYKKLIRLSLPEQIESLKIKINSCQMSISLIASEFSYPNTEDDSVSKELLNHVRRFRTMQLRYKFLSRMK